MPKKLGVKRPPRVYYNKQSKFYYIKVNKKIIKIPEKYRKRIKSSISISKSKRRKTRKTQPEQALNINEILQNILAQRLQFDQQTKQELLRETRQEKFKPEKILTSIGRNRFLSFRQTNKLIKQMNLNKADLIKFGNIENVPAFLKNDNKQQTNEILLKVFKKKYGVVAQNDLINYFDNSNNILRDYQFREEPKEKTKEKTKTKSEKKEEEEQEEEGEEEQEEEEAEEEEAEEAEEPQEGAEEPQEEAEEPQEGAEEPQEGEGKQGKGGLTGYEIDTILKADPFYMGSHFLTSFDSEILNGLKDDKNRKKKIIDFVILNNHHWVACRVDPIKDMSVEYYDPLGRNPPKKFFEKIKNIIDFIKPTVYLLIKINLIQNQAINTNNCGWFAIHFLLQRLLNKSWKFSTGYLDLKEDQIKKLKKYYNYI